MARIVYAWEVGAGYGHLAAFAPLGKALQVAGHNVTFVIRDLSLAESLLAPHGLAYLQAPVWQGPTPTLPYPVSYAEMLMSAGYATPGGLAGLMRAWQGLFDLLQPDLVLFDHAPTALLASRNRRCKRMILGQGFFPPPRVSPVPSIRPESPVTQPQLQAAEQRVLAIINQVSTQPLQTLAEMFEVDTTLMCCFAELDWYPQRPAAEYIGAAMQLDGGVHFQWPQGEGAKVFVYLQSSPDLSERLLASLANLPLRAVIHAPTLDTALLQKYSKAHLTFSQLPLNMRQACAEADLAIGNAGLGMTSAMLLAGKPLLLIPFQQEQFLLASAVARLGAAIMLPAPMPNPDYAQAVQTLLYTASFSNSAKAFQRKYQDFSLEQQVAALVARCTQLLA